MDINKIKELIVLFEESNCSFISVKDEQIEIKLKKQTEPSTHSLPVSAPVKKEEPKGHHIKSPIVKRWSELIELIYFDRNSRSSNIKMLRQASDTLKNKHSVLIFPEGTRSKSSVMNEFKAGALQPAKLANRPILVVTLINSFEFNLKESSKKTFKIVYGPVISPDIFQEKSLQEVSDFIQKEIKNNLDNLLE